MHALRNVSRVSIIVPFICRVTFSQASSTALSLALMYSSRAVGRSLPVAVTLVLRAFADNPLMHTSAAEACTQRTQLVWMRTGWRIEVKVHDCTVDSTRKEQITTSTNN